MRTAELKRIARDFRAGMLGDGESADMCAVVSFALAGFLHDVYGIRCHTEEIWMDEAPQGTTNHVFIRLSDGRILDATADQFGLEPIYIGPMPEQYQEWMAYAK